MVDLNENQPSKADPLVGQVFEGRFQIISTLGRGGMGMVYKAKHIHMGKDVAIKMLASKVSDDRTFLRFEQEARAAASLTHPNIISIFDFGRSADGQAYLVMEYLRGKTLEDIIVDEGLSIARFQRIFSQVCDGMQHAHKKGIIHRDLKPTNLMIVDTEDAEDIVKIVDFGLAKLNNNASGQQLTHEGTVVGSPAFMSPEQCRGDELDHRSDIYSLGCVMYTALAGRCPLVGNNSMATIYKHISDTPEPLSRVMGDIHVSPRLEQVIMQTLSKDREQRPQTMAELGRAISEAIHSKLMPEDLSFTRPHNAAQLGPTGTKLSGIRADFAPTTPAQTAQNQAPELENNLQSRPNKLKTELSQRQLDATQIREKSGEAFQSNGINNLAIAAISLVAVVGIGVTALGLNHKTDEKANANPAHNSKNNQAVLAVAAAPQVISPVISPAKPPDTKSGEQKTTDQTNTEIKKDKTTASLHAVAPNTEIPQKHNDAIASIKPHPQKNTSEAALKKLKAISSAEEYTTKGNFEFNQKNFPAASEYFEKAVKEYKIAYGARNLQQLQTLARLVSSLHHQQNNEASTRYLDEALTILSHGGKAAIKEIDSTASPILTWRPLALGCYDAAMESKNEAARQRFFQWASELYTLALRSWNGEKDSDYYRMLRTQLACARQLGDTKLEANISRQLAMGGIDAIKAGWAPGQGPRPFQRRFHLRQQND